MMKCEEPKSTRIIVATLWYVLLVTLIIFELTHFDTHAIFYVVGLLLMSWLVQTIRREYCLLSHRYTSTRNSYLEQGEELRQLKDKLNHHKQELEKARRGEVV